MSVVLPIQDDDRFRRIVASTGQTVLAIPFPFQADADISVFRLDDGAWAELDAPAEYTVTGAGAPGGGSAILAAPAVAGDVYLVLGEAVLSRTSSIVAEGRFASRLTDQEFDRSRIIQQELRRSARRALKVDYGQSEILVGPLAEGRAVVLEGGRLMPGPNAADIVEAQAYADEAKAARDEAVTTVAAKQDKVWKTYAEALSRDFPARFADTISVGDFLGQVTDDLGTAVNAAMGKARDGSLVYVPPLMSGATLAQAVPIVQGKPSFIDFGNVAVNVAGGITRLRADAPYARSVGGRWFGTRAAGSKWGDIRGFRAAMRDAQAERFDVGCLISNNPYTPLLENVQMRNMVTGAVDVDDCVGAIVRGVRHDVDGVWYGGSYAAPAYGIRVASEGNIVTECDMIHSGWGLFLEAVHRAVYWNFFNNSYLSDSSATEVGVYVLNNSAWRMNGNFMTGCWSATNLMGMRIVGTGEIDGLSWVGGSLHNNLNEAVRIEAANARNIGFFGAYLVGNSQAGSGAANTVYTKASGRVAFKSCEFGRAFGWTPQAYSYVFQDTGGGEIDLSNSYMDPGGYTDAPVKKFGSGDIIIEGVTGVRRKRRGKASVSVGATEITVNTGLDFAVTDENVLISPCTASFGWTDDVGPSSFKIKIPASVAYAAEFAWLAEIDRL